MEELFVVSDSGQLVVNWESLALITSESFVKTIQDQIDYWVDSEGGSECRVVKFLKSDFFFRVWTLIGSSIMTEYRFSFGTGLINERQFDWEDVALFLEFT